MIPDKVPPALNELRLVIASSVGKTSPRLHPHSEKAWYSIPRVRPPNPEPPHKHTAGRGNASPLWPDFYSKPLHEMHDSVSGLPLVSMSRVASPLRSTPSFDTSGHRRSRSYDVTNSANDGVMTPLLSPLRRRSHLHEATRKEKRYSTLLTADLSALHLHDDGESDDSVRRYLDPVELLSPASQE